MNRTVLLTLITAASTSLAVAGGRAHSLTVGDGFETPIGFHDATPTFSWKLPPGVAKQTAYRIEVRGEGVQWDSGWVESDQSVFVPYGGEPLGARQQLAWRVDYRDEKGRAPGWSKPSPVELGLLSASDWKAKWIRPDQASDLRNEPVAYLRREFPVTAKVEKARLYVTARGLFEVHLNGAKVGSDAFTPGWTSYSNRIDTLTYDVTQQLAKGGNAIGVMLGTGWYAGRLGWMHEKGLFGRHPELLMQLEIVYRDGTRQTVLSDEQWRATFDGPIRGSSIYDGETYDARREMPGWDRVGFDDSAWGKVRANPELGAARLTPKPFPTVKVTEELRPVAVTEPSPGRFVFDLGQNMVGWVGLSLPGVKDQTVQIRFAEMLNPDGTIYTTNYRSAKSTDRYTAAKTGTFHWQPTFTFHGFRYVEVSGLAEGTKPKKSAVKGLALRSGIPKIGKFESSHQKLNRLQSNISWGQRGNFLEVPTDCPQRDERLGWTGDAQAFCSTAMFNHDCLAFFKSWLGSMRDDQLPAGQIPHVIPDVLHQGGSPGWMDAATIIPWEVYQRTGDQEVLADNYSMMEKLVGYYRSRAKNDLIPKMGGFGDWLQPHAKGTSGDTPRELLGTAFYAQASRILAGTAGLLGKPDDAKKYQAEAEAVSAAFGKHYFGADGRLQNAPETQTAYILALHFKLVPPDLVTQAEANLLRLIDEAGGHLRTGFLGTPYLAQVLDKAGRPEVAYSLLFKETYPSWFYSINQGATTMWERWDSYTKEKGFHPEGMNSFNHYAYGAIGQWMYERVAGLAPDPAHPGYKHFFVRPMMGGPLTSARAELETAYGKASCGWKLAGKTVQLEVEVPPNTTATIEFPNGRKPEPVGAGKHRFRLKR